MTKEIISEQKTLNQDQELDNAVKTPKAKEATKLLEAPTDDVLEILEVISGIQQKADFEIEYKTRRLEAVTQELRALTKNCDEKLSDNIATLNNSISKLKEETYVLNKLPEAISTHLTHIIPFISFELHKVILQDLDKNLLLRATKIDELRAKAEATTNQLDLILTKITSFQSSQLKRKLIFSTMATLTFLILLAGTSYFMYKKFPSSVWLNTRGDVHIEGGNVTVHKTSASQVSGDRTQRKP